MKRIYSIVIFAAILLAACEPEEPIDNPIVQIPVQSSRAIILNEGPQGNNASLSYCDSEGKIHNDWFFTCNGRPLGDVAQDIVVYGSKAYVTVWGSGSLEAIDTATGHATHIDLGNRGPRYIACAGGNLYITCYNPASIIRIDTATLSIQGTCLLGNYNPEGIAYSNGRLFAVSSWIGGQSVSYDNRVYIVDEATFTVDTIIAVGRNPQRSITLGNGHIIVNSWGEWNMSNGSTEGEATVDINPMTLDIDTLAMQFTNFTVLGDTIYGYHTAYDASWTKHTTYHKMRPGDTHAEEIPISIENPYSISVDPKNGHIIVGDDGNYTSNGDLHIFLPNGTLVTRLQVGMLPSKIAFL